MTATGDQPPSVRSNTIALLIHQTLFRVAWIFKTESVIMPAFLDAVVNSGVARGMLPLLNRTGQSLAPLLLASRLTAAPRKSRWLIRTTFLMGLPFLFLATCVWMGRSRLPPWFAAVFLVAYATFFCLHGVNDMTVSTVLGKLIPAERRGRLVAIASAIGTTAAIVLAMLLLRPWLQEPGQAPFLNIFLFVGSMMMCAGLSAQLLREDPDRSDRTDHVEWSRPFRDAINRLRNNPQLRRLCITAVLFIFSQVIFPHYQALGVSLDGYTPACLMDWVIAQHIGAAVFSSIAGTLADRFGTRASLRFLISCAVAAPLLALSLAQLGTVRWYWITFAWIGLVPVALRMQVHHALEITQRSEHPASLSTLNLCMALPFLASPLVGGCVDGFGFVGPFLSVSGIVFVAALLTWTMSEPRETDRTHSSKNPDAETIRGA